MSGKRWARWLWLAGVAAALLLAASQLETNRRSLHALWRLVGQQDAPLVGAYWQVKCDERHLCRGFL